MECLMYKRWMEYAVEYLLQHRVKFDSSGKEYVEWNDIKESFLYANTHFVNHVAETDIMNLQEEAIQAYKKLKEELKANENDL